MTTDKRIAAARFNAFIDTIAGWQGEFVHLDPSEIFSCYEPEEGHEAACKRILQTIANLRAPVKSMRLAAQVYVDLTTTDDTRLEGEVLGYTYW